MRTVIKGGTVVTASDTFAADVVIEGEAIVSFTVFAEPYGGATRLQVNAKMRTQAARKGSSGKLRPAPIYQCASTGRFEANLIDTIRELTKD